MIGTGLNSILGFIFLIIATRSYSTDVIGLGSTIIAIFGIIAILSELGLGISIIRFLPKEESCVNDLINTVFTIVALASILLSIILYVGIDFWIPSLTVVKESWIFLIFFISFAIAFSLQPIIANSFLAKQKTKYIIFTNLLNNILKIALVLVLALVISNISSFIAAVGIAMVFVVLINLYKYLPQVQEGYYPYITINKKIVKNFGVYSVGNYISRLLLQMTPLILPIFVVNELGPEMNAYFYIAWTFVLILQVIPSSIFNSLFAEGSNQGKVSPSSIIKSVKFMLFLLIPIIFITFIGAEWILRIFGEDYSKNGTIVMKLMILSCVPWGINYLYISIERINKKSKGIIAITATSSVLVLIFCYVLMLKYGLIGLGIGYLIGQTVVGIFVGIHIWHKYFTHNVRESIDAIKH